MCQVVNYNNLVGYGQVNWTGVLKFPAASEDISRSNTYFEIVYPLSR